MPAFPHLAGKVAVVTGAASGIGKAIAAELVAEGMTVVIADVEDAALIAASAEIGAEGVRVDASSRESVQALADEVMHRFGRVDLFCSNAGVATTGRIADMKCSDWEWLFGVNVWGAIHGIEAFLPLLQKNPAGGHLAFTSSMSGFHVTPGIGGYTVTKFALTALAETLAAELEEEGANIGITILCPGPVRSKLGASQRNRPSHLADGATVDSDLEQTEAGAKLRWIGAEVVAKDLVEAIKRGDLYAFTHREWAPLIEDRNSRIAAAFDRAG